MTNRQPTKKNTRVHRDRRDPVFIHSLWRAGSTYLFSVFRRANAGYWCYQEPVHEIALHSKDNPENLLVFVGELMKSLRHPPLTESYFLELYEIAEHWRDVVSKPIIYDEYFGAAGSDGLVTYLGALVQHAKGRPVIQECRTSCRIAEIKRALGGIHIYLWRNPWDQWWSYKSTDYFDLTSQLIVNAPKHPDVIARLRREIGFKEFHDADISREFAHFDLNRLSAEHSYLIFYLLWCLGLIEAITSADLLLNIDTLSSGQSSRNQIKKRLLQLGVTGLDFSDCNVPQTYYDATEKAFFAAQEERAHGLLLLSGYEPTLLNRVESLRRSQEPKLWKSHASDIAAEKILSDSVRARAIVLRFETENSGRIAKVAELGDHERKLQEQAAAAQLQAAQQRAAKEITEQAHNHAEREQALIGQLHAAQQELRQLDQERARREQEMAAQAQAAHQQAAKELTEQARKHAEREQALFGQLQAIQQELRQFDQERARREQEVAALLLAMQKKNSQELADQARNHSEQIQALRREYLEREQALNQQLQAGQQELRRLEHNRADIQHQLEDLHHQIKAVHQREVALRSELTVQTERAASIAAELVQMRKTFSWRLTAPLRYVRGWPPGGGSLSAQVAAGGHANQGPSPLSPEKPSRETYLPPTIDALLTPARPDNHTNQEEHTMTTNQHIDRLLELHDAAFVEAVYKALLGRAPDPDGLRNYLRHLRAGYGKSSIIADIAESAEAKTRHLVAFVEAIYRILLGRAPDVEGLRHYLKRLRDGYGKAKVIAEIAKSTEAKARENMFHEKNIAAFLEVTYLALLGRAPDPDGMRTYTAQLHRGCGKEKIIVQIADSPEAKARMAELPGLRELLAGQKKKEQWFWKIIGRGSRVEHQINRLENEVGRISQQLAKMELESNRRLASLEQAMGVLETPITRAIVNTGGNRVSSEPRLSPATTSEPDLSGLSPAAKRIFEELSQAVTNAKEKRVL